MKSAVPTDVENLLVSASIRYFDADTNRFLHRRKTTIFTRFTSAGVDPSVVVTEILVESKKQTSIPYDDVNTFTHPHKTASISFARDYTFS